MPAYKLYIGLTHGRQKPGYLPNSLSTLLIVRVASVPININFFTPGFDWLLLMVFRSNVLALFDSSTKPIKEPCKFQHQEQMPKTDFLVLLAILL